MDKKVGIRPIEILQSDACRKRLLVFELLIKAWAEVRLDAQRLQYEHAHPDYALL